MVSTAQARPTAGVRRVARTLIVPTRDERFGLYLAAALGTLAAGVVSGQLRLMVIAIPFTVAAAVGGRNPAPAPFASRITLDAERCLEGDVIDGVLEIDAPGRYDVELTIEHDDDALAPAGDEPWAWSIPADVARPVGLPFTIAARRWGDHQLGRLRVRLIDPGSTFVRDAEIEDIPVVSVLPRAVRSGALTRLRSARTTAGAHRARRATSDGYEFADVHPYQPGDRLRDINWAATLRRDSPHVNRRTPELAGDVVIVLDTFPDALRRHSEIATDTITWTGRVAWTIATTHLAANDRVGLAVEGSKVRWMSPRAGRRARLAVYRMLLAYAAPTLERHDRDAAPDRVHVPRGARVIAITPLARRRTLDRLGALSAAGHHVDVLAVDTGALLADRAPSLPVPVSRLRQLLFDERVAALRRAGIGVVVVAPTTADGAIEPSTGGAS